MAPQLFSELLFTTHRSVTNACCHLQTFSTLATQNLPSHVARYSQVLQWKELSIVRLAWSKRYSRHSTSLGDGELEHVRAEHSLRKKPVTPRPAEQVALGHFTSQSAALDFSLSS